MIRPKLALPPLAFLPMTLAPLAVPADAADRALSVGSFDRVRVNGPFEVTHRPGPPSVRVSGDRDAIERVSVRVDGATLSVRMGAGGWGERNWSDRNWDDRNRRFAPAAPATAPIKITLTSPALTAASVAAGGRLAAARISGARVDLSVTGSGAIAAEAVAADRLDAQLIGGGAITLAGRARAARLASNGSGRIDAAALLTDDLSVLLDGPGETLAVARYTARVTNVGLGSVTVSGAPKCTVAARAGGPVACGR